MLKPKPQSNKQNLDTKKWGPHLWKALHAISFGYPEKPSVGSRRYYHEFFSGIKNVIPCAPCRAHYAKIITRTECKISNRVFQNRETLTRWLVKVHNNVNRRVKKPCVSYRQVVDQYTSWATKKRRATPR